RRGLVVQLTRRLTEALRDIPGPGGLSKPSLWVIAAGTLQVFERRLRAGRASSLPKAIGELSAWAASYRTVAPLPLPHPPRRATPPGRPPRRPRPPGRADGRATPSASRGSSSYPTSATASSGP